MHYGDHRGPRRARTSPRMLNDPVYLSLAAGAGLALAIFATMFSWIAAVLGLLVFLLASGRWSWTMRDDFASMLTDADRPWETHGPPEP